LKWTLGGSNQVFLSGRNRILHSLAENTYKARNESLHHVFQDQELDLSLSLAVTAASVSVLANRFAPFLRVISSVAEDIAKPQINR
jgi:hypothetical protein